MRCVLAALVLVLAPASALAEDDDLAPCACDATAAACDAGCTCDLECAVDWSVDECANPAAGCDPAAVEPDDTTLEADDMASPDDELATWTTDAALVSCPDGADNVDGRCIAGELPTDVSGGCSAGSVAGLAAALVVLAVLLRARRRAQSKRRAIVMLALLSACAVDASGWDDAVEAGPTGDPTMLDVYAAQRGDTEASQLLLAYQPLAADAREPVALMSLSRVATGRPIYRRGDRLDPSGGDELLGWAHAGPGDGTADLVELQSPDGAFAYETHADSIDGLVALGYAVTGRIGYVWPPGLSEQPPTDDETPAIAPCTPSIHSALHSSLLLLYASPGADESERFLVGCPGEVVIGEKRETGPVGRMRLADNHAAGGRTGFVLDRHGDKLRALLLRDNGVERTVAYLKHKLAIGYDYIVIDEITAAADYRDGATFNRRLRKLMHRMPIRTIIPYISIDLTQQYYGFEQMRERRLLLRTFKLRARALALEIYLHTGDVLAGAAPLQFRRAADRLALSVAGLRRAGGINLRAISSPGTSMHSSYPQYRYLDRPSGDLDAITRQVNAIRHGSKRTRQQHGLGYYFVNKSDMKPAANAPYSYDGLIRRMRLQALRFRRE